MVWQLWKVSYTNARQDGAEWAGKTGHVIYYTNTIRKKNKEKETSVKESIFLGFCGSREMTGDKRVSWLSAAPGLNRSNAKSL